MNNELPRRGGAHTFEQLEAEVLASQAPIKTSEGGDETGGSKTSKPAEKPTAGK